MTIPLLTPLPPPPLPTDPESVFDSKAGATLSAQKTLVDEMNVNVIPAFNATAVQVNIDADQASQSASDAALERAEALGYKNAAELAASNASTSESNASGYASGASASATAALGYRNEAETYRDQALQYRNEAEAIVGPIGTAASRDAQTSPTDTTPGALMAVGAFGVGGHAPPMNVSDLDSLVAVGRWMDYGAEGVPNRPVGFGYGEIVVGGYIAGYETQTYTSTDGRRAFRSRLNGVWGAWQELYHTGNWYLGTDKQHTANATGAVTLDLAAASIFDLTLTGNVTLALSYTLPPAGYARSIVVRVRQGATAHTLTWWGSITWLAATTPAAPAANKVAEYVLSGSAEGWIGRVGAKN